MKLKFIFFTLGLALTCVLHAQTNSGIGYVSNSTTLGIWTSDDGSNPVIAFTPAQNVGIGTLDTKGYKLAVNGNAIFNLVKVQQYGQWADYVFERNYQLLSLGQVRQYISRYHHLPGIPTSTEVKDSGLDIGTTQSLLLQKIEELTLYLIKADQRISSLEQQNELLRTQTKQLTDLQQQIDQLKKLLVK